MLTAAYDAVFIQKLEFSLCCGGREDCCSPRPDSAAELVDPVYDISMCGLGFCSFALFHLLVDGSNQPEISQAMSLQRDGL